MKTFFLGILVMVLSLVIFAFSLKAYTLWSTNGECDVVGTCACPILEKYGYVLDTCHKNLDVYKATASGELK